MFRGLGAIAWVLPMLGCWILLLLTFRAYNKLWSGRKEAILKAVCGLHQPAFFFRSQSLQEFTSKLIAENTRLA